LPTDALLLFADRAKSTVPGFAIDAQNRPLIATICRRLEGIPLAIELVVGRLRSMSLPELNAELTEHWDLLTHGSRAAPQRHQTMSACIDWSFDLCTPQEQRLWATLSVFADGFELDGVREVATESGTADTLLSLVDKSIVTTWEIDGVRRFRLLPPLRQRGISTLREQGRLYDVRRRHRDWCVDLARRAQEDWISPRQAEWIDQLKREAANIRLALEFCSLEEGEAEPGLMMGSYLLDYGLASGLFRQGRTWFDLLLGSATTPEIRSIALRTAIWWAAMQGDLERAAELVAEERSILDSLDGHRQALHTQSQALVALFSGEFGDATTLFKQSIAGLTQFGDVSQQVASLCLLGLNCTLMGDLEGALEAHSACIAITEPEGEPWYRSYSYWIAGLAVAAGGDHERALSMQRDSLRLRTHIDDPLGMGLSYEAFALLATDKNPERAARLMGVAEAMWERSETSARELPGINAYHDDCIGRLVIELGEQAYQEAFAAGRRMGREEALAYALEEEPSRPPLSEPSPSAKPKVLTTREIEVAELVSQGMSNQEIADKLVISRRTAETHVEHILTKLGLTRRTQISAWLTES
jgi:non-specific serine/threonine protein kinase